MKYNIIEWPESQALQEHPRFKECLPISAESSGPAKVVHPAYACPEDIFQPAEVQHEDVLSLLNNTYKAKNADYGDSFKQTCDRFGITAAMVRMSDKWNRLVNLAKQVDEAKVKDESIDDTLLDLANYAIMTYMWRKNRGGYGSDR